MNSQIDVRSFFNQKLNDLDVMKNLLSFRNERNLYKRKCSESGTELISIYKEGSKFPVIKNEIWWSDKFDGLQYGRNFDFSRGFFEQFFDLYSQVPRMALLQSQNENSPYTNCVSNLKDCHMLFSADYNRDCMYGVWVENCNDCVDCYLIEDSELCYEVVFSKGLYNCNYVVGSQNCSDCDFVVDCIGSKNCFMSVGLRNAQYCINNKQYSKEEYQRIVASYTNDSEKYREAVQFFKKTVEAMKGLKFERGNVENSSGKGISNLKDCKNCDLLSDSRDCERVVGGFGLKDCQYSAYVSGELGYMNLECVPMPFNSAFNMNCYGGANLFYSDSCMNNVKDSFGCIGLKGGQYCILNKQYSKEEYEVVLLKIIDHMKKMGEWGKFFPVQYSPFDYCESNAQDLWPVEVAVEENEVVSVEGVEVCEVSGKAFKLNAQERRFYERKRLPKPNRCFEVRHKERMDLVGLS